MILEMFKFTNLIWSALMLYVTIYSERFLIECDHEIMANSKFAYQ